MPLTKKGEKIMGAMAKEYGPDKAKRVFYASKNAGKITGVDMGKSISKAHDEAMKRKHAKRHG